MKPLSFKQKMKSLCLITIGGVGVFSSISIYKQNDKFYKNYVMPVVQLLEPEVAHRFAIYASKYRIIAKSTYIDSKALEVNVFNRNFPNPIGIAAGFDKSGEAILGLQDLGFGFIEIGSVTPQAQSGNEKPRVFRLKKDLAVINRYGFNNDGHVVVFNRLNSIKQQHFEGIIGVNLGKNKTSDDPINDYVQGLKLFGPLADYVVINISSPNTPGLRNLQNKDELRALLSAIVKARNNLPEINRPALLVKLAPDLTYEQRKDIAEIVIQKECKMDGLIVCNTTIDRPDFLQDKKQASQMGGLSGKPLKDISTKMIEDMYKLTKGMPIIGVGGISTGVDAYEKIKAGACIVQLYTALVYEGPTVVTKIKKELLELLIQDGYKNVSEAIGKGN